MILEKIFKNDIFWVTLLAGFFAQTLKFLIYWIKEKKPNLEWLFTTGGMPSSHSTSVMCLSTMVGIREGFDSLIFGITVYFSLIIMYDAAGLRRAAGEQARIINTLLKELGEGKGIENRKLKELLGHTPIEVLTGASLGIIIGVIFA